MSEDREYRYVLGRVETVFSDGSVSVLELTIPDDGLEENSSALQGAAKAAGLIGDNEVVVTIRPVEKPLVSKGKGQD